MSKSIKYCTGYYPRETAEKMVADLNKKIASGHEHYQAYTHAATAESIRDEMDGVRCYRVRLYLKK